MSIDGPSSSELGKALRDAVIEGAINEVERLLSSHSQLVHDRGNHSLTALHVAARLDRVEELTLLLRSNAVPNQQDDFGRSALHYAAAYGRTQCARLLIEFGADVNLLTAILWSPLLFAVQYNHLNVVQLLLDAKASFSLTDNLGWSPLHIACREGHETIAMLLLQAGADVNSTDKRGWTPLHVAVQSNRISVIPELLRARCQVNCQEEAGWSPLHITAQRGYDQAARLLISAGASVDLQTNKGRSALFYAVMNGHSLVVTALLKAGADPSLKKPNSDLSPLACACFYGNRGIALELIRYLADCGQSLTSALPESCQGYTDFLILPRWTKTESLLITGEMLHAALKSACFTSERAAAVSAAADVLQSIIKMVTHSESLIVGSYSDGWGCSLSCMDGRIDPDSDIDMVNYRPGCLLHLKGERCSCGNAQPESIVEYENGHVKKDGFPSSPSHPFNGSKMKPAMDNVAALPICCYPYIGILEDPERLARTHLTKAVLDALQDELRRPHCHVVAAAPPGKEGEYLRVSTTFFERIVMRSLTDCQGQLFIMLKYLVKSMLSSKVRGLKTYHVKTLLFCLLDETPQEFWKPDNFLALLKRALEYLIDGIKITTGSNECMKHFFLSGAIVYLRKNHSSKDDIEAAVNETLCNLVSALGRFVSELQPPLDSTRLYFQPFLMLPHTVLPPNPEPSVTLLFAEVYSVVRNSIIQLSNADCNVALLMDSINRIPDSALTARESLRILARMKLKATEDTADPVALVMEPFSKIPRPVDVPADAASPDTIWDHLNSNGHSTWKFCFQFNEIPKLQFLPAHLGEAFPCQTTNYNDYRYVNFNALYVCLCHELGELDPESATAWFEQVVSSHHSDVQETFVTLNYCHNIDLLVRLIQTHGQALAVHPLTSDKLDDLMESSRELREMSCLKTLERLSHS